MGVWWVFGGCLVGVVPNLGMAWGFGGGWVGVWWWYLKMNKSNASNISPNLGIAWGFGGGLVGVGWGFGGGT